MVRPDAHYGSACAQLVALLLHLSTFAEEKLHELILDLQTHVAIIFIIWFIKIKQTNFQCLCTRLLGS